MKVAPRSQINDFKESYNDPLLSAAVLLKIQVFYFYSAVPKPTLAQFQWANKGIKRCGKQTKQKSRESWFKTTNKNRICKRMNQIDGYERRVEKKKEGNLNVIKSVSFQV